MGTRAGEAVRAVGERVDEAAGGPARRRVIVLLAGVLGLDTADKAALSAVAGGLKHAFGIGNTEIGILVSIVSLVGAVFTLPMGVLTDRARRTRLLWGAIALWTVAMLISGAATSYLFLLLARVFLGVVTAVAAPAVASLLGDYFPARERGRIYGMVLSGELIGLGIGFIVAGVVSDWTSWRWAFWSLVPFSAAVGYAVWRYLPEPARGGQSWLRAGAEHVRSEEDAAEGRYEDARADDADPDSPVEGSLARRAVEEQDVPPREDLVLHDDPAGSSFWWALKYVLSVPTVRVLILTSALVYFYFSGLRAFAVIFVTNHYSVSRAAATLLVLVLGLGAIGGVFLGGRISDRLIERGRFNGRILIVPVVLVATVLLFAPAVWTRVLWVAVPLFIAATFFLAAANPPVDAARLDIMHPRMWGRAESVRQFLRGLSEAAAPTTFGVVSAHVFGGRQAGLQSTFLVMLVVLLIAAVVVLRALKTYRRDVATAAASVRNTDGSEPYPS